jgi:hypothetical protein
MVPRAQQEVPWIERDLKVTNKQQKPNKQTTFFHK